MSKNQTHTKMIARALSERTGMPYTAARRQVVAAMAADVLPRPFSDENLPTIVDYLASEDTARLVAELLDAAAVVPDPDDVMAGEDAERAAEVAREEGASVHEAVRLAREYEATKREYWAKHVEHPYSAPQVDTHHLVKVLRRLGVLMDHGYTIAVGFDIASRSVEQAPLRHAVADVSEKTAGGMGLAAALRLHPQYFDDFTIAIIDSGMNASQTFRSVADTLASEEGRTLTRGGADPATVSVPEVARRGASAGIGTRRVS